MSDPITGVIDAAELDERYQPTRTRASICLDSELVLEINRLETMLQQAQQGDLASDPVSALAEQILALRERAIASEQEFVFRSIGRLAYRDLVREHPPTDEQKKLVGPDFRLAFNPDTFQPALLAVACETVRGGSVAWWTKKCQEWGDGQIERLWQACIAAQQGVNDVPKAAFAFAATRSRGESSE